MTDINFTDEKVETERLSRLLRYQQQDPENLTLCIDIGFSQLALNRLVDARESANKAVNLAPDKYHGYSLRGLVAMREGDLNTATTALQQATELGETAPSVFYNYAFALANTGRFEEAELPAAQAVQHFAQFPHAPSLYIRILHYVGKIEEAISYAESMADEAPPGLNAMLSTLYMDAEKLDKARVAATTALNEDSANAEARTTLGLLALQDLDSSTAETEFDRALASHSNQGRALLGKGMSILLRGDLPKAAEIFERVVTGTNMSVHIGSWHALAWCHILQKNPAAAEQALKNSLEIDRNFSETHGGLAVVALMRGNIDSAIQSAKRAQGLNKNNFAGNFAQGLIQQVAGNAAQAAAIIDKVLDQSILPDGSSIRSLLVKRMVLDDKSIPENKTLH